MAFGQPSGFPASPKQIQELLTLLEAAGHSDFRDARGPMGFTQRQAAGKFTGVEAAAFVEQLRDAEDGASVPVAPKAPARLSTQEAALRGMECELLLDELRRRGWIVTVDKTVADTPGF